MQQIVQTKQDTLNRLKSASGHLAAVARMVDEEQYCIDIIYQIQAVQAALNKISLLVLDDHMHTCVTDAIQNDDPAERERVLAEILAVFEARGKL